MAYSNTPVTGLTTDLTERMRAGVRMVLESVDPRYASGAADGNVEAACMGDAKRLIAAIQGDTLLVTNQLTAPAITALLTSAARTVTTASADQTNTGAGLVARGVIVVMSVTANATGSITLSIRRKNLDGTYTNIVTAGAAYTAANAGKVVLVLDPLIGAQTAGTEFDGVQDGILPQTWGINVVANNANSVTYSVAGYLIR